MCVLSQQTSPKRWFGNRTMTSFCADHVTEKFLKCSLSAWQLRMTKVHVHVHDEGSHMGSAASVCNIGKALQPR